MIKRLNINHINALTAVSRTCFIETYPQLFSTEQFKSFFKNHFNQDVFQTQIQGGHPIYFGYFIDNELIAYFTIEHRKVPESNVNKTIYIDKLYIIKKTHRKGIGKKIIQFTIELAKKQHIEYIWLAVWSGNQSAQQFYKKLGFEKIGEQRFIFEDIDELDYRLLLRL